MNAKFMLITQALEKKEDIKEKKFMGLYEKVLDKLLKSAGIKRHEIYVTNLIKCILPKSRKPKSDEVDACSNYLDKEIKLINPKILVPLGYDITRYIFKKYYRISPPPEITSSIFGKLFLANDKKILPLPHPVILLNHPEFEQELIKKYRKLQVLLTNCKWFQVCPMNRYYQKRKIDRKWIELYCKGDWESCVRYQMEERNEMHPDWMLPDGTLDERLKEE